ncbi:MAG: hypothetical protein M3Y53_05055 [Thermoproteota archaeon]|nr:hypothetical protein [Thermoproteota archaeon]
MTTTSVCGVCKEDIPWLCSRHTEMEDATHAHAYERAVCKEKISAIANSYQSHLIFSANLM